MALSNGTFRAIQTALESWSNAECLKFGHAINFTATAQFTAPQLSSIKARNATASISSIAAVKSRALKRWVKSILSDRAECRTEKVQENDSCAVLATRCSISGADFTKYNSDKGFCSKVQPR
ncbi:chitinase [Penicillium samsonianum]|uniref:chitinase n=1 Tax=Penicillium samsonianum TaxID=1882272 RepID=UPI0025484685|nr:chitinase [Penicillium samsonianum]KAJ6127737.1 chitinase [Penicillium samsonianum]